MATPLADGAVWQSERYSRHPTSSATKIQQSPWEIRGLIARLRAAEVDAKRWRHARIIVTVRQSRQLSNFINLGCRLLKAKASAQSAIDCRHGEHTMTITIDLTEATQVLILAALGSVFMFAVAFVRSGLSNARTAIWLGSLLAACCTSLHSRRPADLGRRRHEQNLRTCPQQAPSGMTRPPQRAVGRHKIPQQQLLAQRYYRCRGSSLPSGAVSAFTFTWRTMWRQDYRLGTEGLLERRVYTLAG